MSIFPPLSFDGKPAMSFRQAECSWLAMVDRAQLGKVEYEIQPAIYPLII